jgi:hypothetical protein
MKKSTKTNACEFCLTPLALIIVFTVLVSIASIPDHRPLRAGF